jgi:signal transduction histidine kinase/PAS domain-containing protein
VGRSRDVVKSALLTRLRHGQALLAAADPRRLVHELQANQIELEMQNRELMETRELLEVSRDRFSELYDLAPFADCTIDRRGVIQEINLKCAALLGQPRGLLIGVPLIAVARLADLRPFWELLAVSCDGGQPATAQVAMTIGKRALTIQMVGTPVRGGGHCRVVLSDVTEHKRAEADMRRAHTETELARARASLLSDAGALLNDALPELQLDELASFFVNRLADWCIIELFDPPASEGTSQALVVAHIDPRRRDALLELARKHPSAIDHQSPGPRLRALRADYWMVAPIVARERVLGVLTLAASARCYDDADREVAHELGRRIGAAVEHAMLFCELRRVVHTHDEVLRLVSHDLGNSLAALRLQASILKSGADDAEAIKARADTLEQGVDYMMRLVSDLVDLASGHSAALSILQQTADARALVRDVVAGLRLEIEANKLRLTVELPDEQLPVECDRDRIHQVLWNLLGNANKYTPAKGAILVRVERVEQEVVFTVQDSGRGIPRRDLPHIFEMRWRAQPTSHSGDGLGLFIARCIVEAHRGRIWVDSWSGRGTRLRFALPLSPPPALAY